MRTARFIAALGAAFVSVAGCTVAIPDADHFPEARDVQTADVASDVADVAKDAKPDALDVHDVAGTDAADVKPDVPDVAPLLDAEVSAPDAVTAEVAEDVAEVDVGATDAVEEVAQPDAAAEVGVDAVDAGPTCTPTQCDDANPCTFDDCGADGQCIHASLAPTPCTDDGLPCTGDSCLDGVCTHTTLLPNWCIISGTCHASGEFTADGCGACQPDASPVAWTPLADTTTCTDGTACTVGDHCQAGACLPGAVTSCDDGNPCTADVCDPTSGCSNANVSDYAGCPALGACKLPGYCVSGTCQSDPKLWSTSLDGGYGGDDQLVGVVVTASGDFIAVGTVGGGPGKWSEGWAERFNASGNALYAEPSLVDPNGNAHHSCIAQAADGSLALGGATSTGAAVLLVDAQGTPKKTVQPFAAFGVGDVIALAAQGTGWLALDGKAHAARLDNVGKTSWLTTAAELGPTALVGIAALSDGGAIAVGSRTSSDPDAPTAVAVRFDSAGVALWQRAFGHAGSAFTAVQVLSDGTIAVTGTDAANLWFGTMTPSGGWLGGGKWTPSAGSAVYAAALAADDTWRLVGTDGTSAWQGAFATSGALLWQKTYDPGSAHGLAFLSAGEVLVGETAAPQDGLIVRADAWGEDSCAKSQICSNLTLSACADAVSCTADLCAAGACGHAPLDSAPCADAKLCAVAGTCNSGTCATAEALFDATDATVSQWSVIAAHADGGAIVAGTASLLARLDASGAPAWSHFVAGGAVTDVAALANGWSVALQGDIGGMLRRFTDTGDAVATAITVDAASGGTSRAIAALSDDSVVVVGTSDVGLPTQAAFFERFDGSWTGTPTALPGTFGLSQGLAVAPRASGGFGVLVLDGVIAMLRVYTADSTLAWSKPLSVKTDTLLAAMPDGGWLVAGLGPKGVALERSGPDSAFEFAVQWAIDGLTDVRGLTVLPDGTSAVAIQRLTGGLSQGGVARFGPLGGLLSVSWGSLGSQAFDLCTVARPEGVWTVGSRSGGGWLARSDIYGTASCTASGTCISQSLVCDDGNPCTNDGCALGLCTITAPAAPATCLDGGLCTAAGACPLLGTCGDGKCNLNETSANCAADCAPACDAMNCDDGDPCTIDYCQAGVCAIGGAPDGTACALGKSCVIGQCAAPGCGDGVCASGETATSCPADCPACGDGICAKGENNHLCPADCAKPASGCQNMCGWKSTKPGGGVCWCDPGCTPGAFGDCCDDKATFCP